MKVAVINTFDARDINIWSGIPYHISLMLDDLFDNAVSYIQLPTLKRDISSYLLGFYYNKIQNKKYYTWAHDTLVSKNKRAYQKLVTEDYDVIITFDFYLVPALKKLGNKVIYWGDQTFKSILNFYSGYSNLSRFSINNGHLVQKKALNESDYIIYASDWAIDTAINFYGTDGAKFRKIAFGSNLSIAADEKDVTVIIKKRCGEVLPLLFLTADWERKGGDDAVILTERLNATGIKAVLHVVGAPLPEKHQQKNYIINHGFINKKNPNGEQKIIELFKSSAFFVMPTRADTTPVAFSEANSFALPVLTTNVGGIPSVICNYVNGYRVDVDTYVDQATEFICTHLPGTVDYETLCLSSYKRYQEELSWEQVEQKFKSIITELSPN
jgi:glycosyltransferase involved in cell wall biosynthesis